MNVAPDATLNLGSGGRTPRANRRVRRDLQRLITDEEPWFIGCQEATKRRKALATVAKVTGYQLVQAPGLPGHVAALLHPDCRVDGWGTIRLNESTKVGRRVAGSRITGRAPARWLLGVRYTDPAGVKRVAGVSHLVPSSTRKGNAAARSLHEKQVRRIARWYVRRMREARLYLDGNIDMLNPRQAAHMKPLARVADLHSAPSHGPRAIDVIATPKGTPIRVRALSGYGSDHRPVITEGVTR